MSKQRQIIIILNQPIDERNISRFYLKKLSKITKNFHIINFYNKFKIKNNFLNSNLLKINIKNIINLILKNKRGYYIDFSNKSIKEMFFLKFLSLLRYKRITVDVGLIPVENIKYHILKNNLNNNQFINLFLNIFTRFFYKIGYLFLLPKPHLAFTSGVVGKKLSKNNGAKKIIDSHNLDYDNFLKIKKKKIIKKNFAVYIDQDFGNNDDLKNDGVKFANNDFENKMKYFLNDIDQKIINVKIAGGNRRKVKKKLFNLQTKYSVTDVMIAQSKLVIGHNSTALQYAILFEKPILLLSCNELKKIEQIHQHILTLKKIIGCEYLDIDIDNLKSKKKLFKINRKKYYQYKKNYIKSNLNDSKTFFQIFKKNFLQINKN